MDTEVFLPAAIVFFAFIGFDAVSTAAPGSKKSKKGYAYRYPRIIGNCTILYILFSFVLTGVAPYTDFVKSGKEASVAYALKHIWRLWLAGQSGYPSLSLPVSLP